VRKVIGIDVDKAAETNPLIDEFRKIEGTGWPIEMNSINLVLCDNVLEHVPDPVHLFSEVKRVLKDGGYLCIRTPNAWSYVALVSKLVPNRHHTKVLAKVQNGRSPEDVFPTYYGCNSIRKLRRLMESHGFDHVVYGYEAEPSYLSFSSVAYWAGVIHQRFAPKLMKPAIFAFGKLAKD
jgi:SAM-dependent methyltransferase